MNRLFTLIVVPALSLCLGCQTGPVASLFVKKDRTSIQTPTLRAEAAHAIAAKATGADSSEQQELLNDLARRIQAENDPLVREAIVESVAAFSLPLADQVLQAGLSDSDSGVRIQCCQALGARRSAASVASLARVSQSDESFDVRVAATKALGEVESPEAVRALASALEDQNPAMQFAGVEAMRNATGQDLGGDVSAYLALAKGETPVVATKPKDQTEGYLGRWSPF